MRTLLLSFLLLAATFTVNAQLCDGPGRLPTAAQAVCGNLTFVETNVQNCTGPDLPNPTSGCGQVTSDNSRWYKFHCYVAGNFGFMLSPNSPTDDYDWEIMDITGHLPGDVYTMELRVSLNLSGQPGKTGCTASGISDINCGGGNPGTQFNKMLNLVAGHDYLLMVNNWTGSNKPYTINFSGSAELNNNVPPTITSVSIVGCDASKIKVTFSEDIICDSTTVSGSEFTITAGTHVITGIASDCSLGANGVPYLIINLQAAIPPGNYQLNVANGTDGNTLENVCLIPMLPVSIPFTVPTNAPVAVNTVTYTGCAPTVLNVSLTKPIWCSSVSVGEFAITPGNPAIAFVQSACSTGGQYTDQLQIVLQNPLPFGNYQLVIGNGSDGNTFIDTCGNPLAATTIPFSIAQTTTPPIIQSIDFDGCHPDKIVINFNKPIACASLTAAGSEIALSPAFPVNSITYNCTSGIYTSQVTMHLAGNLPPNSYQITINNGVDGNTLSDTCLAFIPAGYSVPFIALQPLPPVIQSFGYDPCHRDRLVVNFDKPVACASLTANGSEFKFTPVGPVLTGISSNCGTANYTSQVTLFFQNQMPTQIFNVMVFNGTDGNTLSDTCSAFMPQGYSQPITAPLPPPPLFDSLQVEKCAPTFIKVFFNHPIRCSSILPGGGQFWLVGGPVSPIFFISATPDPATCALGYTNSILLQLPAPIIAGGLYRVIHPNLGSTVVDTCNMPQPAFDKLDFTLPGSPPPVFTSQVKWGCVMDTIVLSHSGANGSNSWRWNFSDGSTATGQTVSKTFPVATPTVDVQLIVTNGVCSDTVTNTITLGNVFQPAFINTPADTVCINTPVNFTNTSSGNIVDYLWDFGDVTQFNGQTPPTHAYPVNNIYNVQLIATDNHGCKDTASKLLYVNTKAFIDFTGLKPQYCTNSQVVLTRKIASTIDSYIWDNGDGKTFTNEVDVNFSYANEGVYTITLTGNDKYCGVSTVSKTVPVYQVPKVRLGADTVLCQSDRMLIGVTPTGNYNYLWNTGATTPQIYTDIFTREYNLTADNHGCKGYDAMSIKVLSVCLIKVPGAFTPNGDGLNDQLKALNADLAKNFSFQVFNRLGQLIFTTHNPLEGWDGYYKGTAAVMGTYVWMLSYIDPWTGVPVKEKGTSILLR